MSRCLLGQHDLPDLMAFGRVNSRGIADGCTVPGSWVRHRKFPSSFGLALSRCWVYDDRPMQVLVLWTNPPVYKQGIHG
jgi:hypothetical protein